MRGKKAETKEKVPKVQTAEGDKTAQAETVYRRRFDRHLDELRWLYMELYDNGSMFAELCDHLHRFYRGGAHRRVQAGDGLGQRHDGGDGHRRPPRACRRVFPGRANHPYDESP